MLETLAKQHVSKWHPVTVHSPMDPAVGENQAISTNLTINYHLLVGKWYEEGKHYDIDTNSCVNEESCDRHAQACNKYYYLVSRIIHYMQIIWAITTDIGCAIKKCKHAAPSVVLLVCHYGPG